MAVRCLCSRKVTPDRREGAMQAKLHPGKNGDSDEYPGKVGIIYSDVRKSYFPTEAQYLTEKGAQEDAQVIADHFTAMRSAVFLYAGDEELSLSIYRDQQDVVINLVESVRGDERLAFTIPRMLANLGIPYTGADADGMELDTNKFLVK